MQADEPTGVHLAGFGGRGFEMTQLSLPSDVCVNPLNGSVAVCDMNNHRIMEYNPGMFRKEVAPCVP